MNSVTRQELKEFVQEILNFAYAVNDGTPANGLVDLLEKGEKLMEQLDKDETIV